jgi:hypothetical protein
MVEGLLDLKAGDPAIRQQTAGKDTEGPATPRAQPAWNDLLGTLRLPHIVTVAMKPAPTGGALGFLGIEVQGKNLHGGQEATKHRASASEICAK